jgi:hypothetical protein
VSHLLARGRRYRHRLADYGDYSDDYDYDDDDYDDDDDDYDYDYDDYLPPVDHRWRLAAIVAGAVFLAAVIVTAVIVSGDSGGSQPTTVGPPAGRVTPTPRPSTSAAPAVPPTTSRAPEAFTTPTPRATTAAPAVPPGAALPAPPAVNPRTVVYTVSGTKQLLDFISIIYTDAQGHPHTDVNVSLPWHKTVVLDPGVQLKSVVATSLSGQLNCAITDAAGQTVVASTNNSLIATCTR